MTGLWVEARAVVIRVVVCGAEAVRDHSEYNICLCASAPHSPVLEKEEPIHDPGADKLGRRVARSTLPAQKGNAVL